MFFFDQPNHKIRILAVGQLPVHRSIMSEMVGGLQELEAENKAANNTASNPFFTLSGVYQYRFDTTYSFVMFLGNLGSVNSIPAAVVQHVDQDGRSGNQPSAEYEWVRRES
jgi:hypothetical protein